MPNAKREDFAEILYNLPWWRKGDPGPDWPWIIEEISQEARVELVVSQLEYQREVVAAQSKAIERNIAILNRARGQKG